MAKLSVRSRRTATIVYCLVSCVALLAIVLLVRSSRSPTLKTSSENLGRCLQRGDTACISAYITDDPVYARLHPDDQVKVIAWASDHLRGSGRVQAMADDLNAESRGNGLFVIGSDSGPLKEQPLQVIVAYHDDGIGVIRLLPTLITHKWLTDKSITTGDSQSELKMRRLVHGIDKDAEFLVGVGYNEFYNQGQSRTLNELRRQYESSLAKQISKD